MARPRKSTAAMEASGAFRKDPSRRRSVDNEPNQSGPLGDPPACLSKRQVEAWNEIVGMLQDGVLKRSDRVAIELAARYLAGVRAGTATATEGNTLMSIVSKLGATPADRSRVLVPTTPKGNTFEE